MWGELRALVGALVLLAPSAGVAQVFIPQGPAPSSGPLDIVQAGNPANGGTVAGAVQAILLDPALGANTIFLGSPNGGVWRSTDGGTTWKALTDNQASLSIASLALDPNDTSGNTLIAGIGITSNGGFNQQNFGLSEFGRGGRRTGLLYSTDGGNNWAAIGGTTLAGQSVIGVVAAGSTILAATFEEQNPTKTHANGNALGLYISTDTGQNFAPVTPSSGLPAGPVTALVADPGNATTCGKTGTCTFYAAVTSPSNPQAAGVYMSNTSGTTWSPVFTNSTTVSGGSNSVASASDQLVAKLAAGPNGSVAIAFANATTEKIQALYLSQNSGASWSALAVPVLSHDPINQAVVNLAVAIDPKNTSIVYVAGDGLGSDPFSVTAFRVQGHTAISITDGHTSNDSTAHSDARALVIDAAGNLLLGSDGGIYVRSNPRSDNGAWTDLNTTLQIREAYAVAYDTLNKRLAAATQDTGVALQSAPGSPLWNALIGADGVQVVANGAFQGAHSAIYYGTDDFGFFNRLTFDATGTQLSPNTSSWGPGAPVNCSYNGVNGGCAAWVPDPSHPGQVMSNSPFYVPVALNGADPSNLAIAPGYANYNGINGNFVYVARDTAAPGASSVNLQMTNVGGIDASSIVTALAYGIRPNNNQGTSANPDALLAGVNTSSQGQLWFTPNAPVGGGGTALSQLTAYAGGQPTAMVFDPTSPSAQSSPGQIRFYVADSADLWGTRDQGTSFTQLTSNLPAGFVRPTSVEFVSNNGVNALLVGGLNTPQSCNSLPSGCVISTQQSPITVADSDTNGNLSGWRPFGQGLPNAWVTKLIYYPSVDVLVAGAIGRGVWTLYDVTSYFPQATTLQFGLADNDSQPDPSFLKDGKNLDGTTFSRALVKYGTGTLTIGGAASYTGGTTINDGTLMLGAGGAGGSLMGNVTFCSDTSDSTCNATTSKSLAFNRSDTYTFAGSITGPGQLLQLGSGTTILTSASTYTGPTMVEAGTLLVHGSITSSVTVDGGGTLGGYGEIGGDVTVNAGGVFSPGASVGTLTVHQNVLFNPGSIYYAEIQGNTSDRIKVDGTATLNGTVQVAFLGGSLANQYTILSTTGGRTGTFDNLLPLNAPAFITTSLAYSTNAVQLDLSSAIVQTPGLTGNQSAVGAALDTSFNTGGGTLPALLGIPQSQLPAALDMLSGEGVSGTQETAFGAAGMFNAMMMDQGTFWRSGETLDLQGVPLQPLQYASGRPMAEQPVFKAMPASPPPLWRAWFAGFDSTTKLGGEAGFGSAGLSHDASGLAAGVDYRPAPDLLLGVAAGASSANFSVSDRSTSGQLDGGHIGGYGVKTWGSLYAAGALSISLYNNDTTRNITGVGSEQTATGRFRSTALSGRVEVGAKQAFAGFAVTPFAAVQFAELWQDGFTETDAAPAGAGPLGLTFGSTRTTSLPTFLGAQIDSRTTLANGSVLSPYGRLSWVHEFDPNRAVNAAFIALPGPTFTVDGVRAAPDAARVDAGAKLAFGPHAWFFADFHGEFSDRSQSYAGNGGIKVAW